jgi:PPOX class probable FMN-dependent enzyme
LHFQANIEAPAMKIDTVDALRELYGFVSGRAARKQLAALEVHSKNFIAHSPFLTLSTVDSIGNVDVSPRGGAPGFVVILNDTCFCIPDAKGNKRLDSMENIIQTGRVGTLFMIPGVDETLRVNGSAHISTDPALLGRFTAERSVPQSCLVIEVEEVFLHCAKAFMRSRLWAPEGRIERKTFPTMSRMINDQLSSTEQEESQEDMVARYQHDL